MIAKYIKKEKEFTRQQNFKIAWKLSLKYSNLLIKNLDKNATNLDYFSDIFKMYIRDLKSNKITFNNSNKFIKIWETTNYTYLKNYNKNITNIRKSIKLLNYTSIINN